MYMWILMNRRQNLKECNYLELCLGSCDFANEALDSYKVR